MSRWQALGGELEKRASVLVAEVSDHKRQEDYAEWAKATVFRCVDELAKILREHCSAFPDVVRSQLQVELTTPDTSHAEQRVLCITFGPDSVHLHAQWRAGSPPTLHVLLSRKRGGRTARLITSPGGWLRADATNSSGFQVCPFDGSSNEISLDELSYRALRLLAAGV